ncbi:RING-type E3 ubiquitin transferase [Sarracenia purpurea var. burkii]
MDDNSSSNPSTAGVKPDNYYAYNGKLMLISLVVLVLICIAIALFHSYARWVHHRRRNRDHHRAPRSDYLVFNFGPSAAAASGHGKGLERSVLHSLPTFFYDSAAHNPPLECTVCLSEFGHNESGRFLPNCRHCFHIACIDVWFQSHSNCPLCRAPVKPVENPVEGKPSLVKTSVSEAGSSSGSCFSCSCDYDKAGFPASSLPSGDQTKRPELCGRIMEVPTAKPDTEDPKEGDTGSDSGEKIEMETKEGVELS